MKATCIALCLTLFSAAPSFSHHAVTSVYDASKRVVIEVEVYEFGLVHPHPLMLIEILAIAEDQQVEESIEVGQVWTLEMDNLWELTDLGLNANTFVPGDTLRVAVDPSRHEEYRKNTMYLRAIEHQRLGIIYIHNVRELFNIDIEQSTSLESYLDLVR